MREALRLISRLCWEAPWRLCMTNHPARCLQGWDRNDACTGGNADTWISGTGQEIGRTPQPLGSASRMGGKVGCIHSLKAPKGRVVRETRGIILSQATCGGRTVFILFEAGHFCNPNQSVKGWLFLPCSANPWICPCPALAGSRPGLGLHPWRQKENWNYIQGHQEDIVI